MNTPVATVKIDATATFNFLEAVDSLETSQAILGLCGKRNYQIMESDGTTASNWCSIASTSTAGTYKVTIAPINEA